SAWPEPGRSSRPADRRTAAVNRARTECWPAGGESGRPGSTGPGVDGLGVRAWSAYPLGRADARAVLAAAARRGLARLGFSGCDGADDPLLARAAQDLGPAGADRRG